MKNNKQDQRYKTTISYLFEQLPMFQRMGATAFKKDLKNILALCEQLGQPQQKFPSIHIAGTNGKGSTTHIIAAILQASGKRVGVYTSPHYKDFRERIKINGQLVSKDYVIEFVEKNRRIFDKIQPSFFEISVAMAFHYFALKKVDIAIIEVGLGGRLDSTNILLPILSVITNIGYDHQQFLGDTLPAIAKEKAGIIKPNIPVVIGETHKDTKPVFDKIGKINKASLYYADTHIQINQLEESAPHHTFYSVNAPSIQIHKLKANLKGIYQLQNVRTAIATVEVLNKKVPLVQSITQENILTGLLNLKENTYFIGRWQQLGTHPTIIADSAHNEEGIKIAMQGVHNSDYKHLHIVLGMVKDKNINKILPLLPSTAFYYFAKANIPRGLDAIKLHQQAKKYGLKGRHYVSVKNALQAAKRKARPEDLIYVGGSIFIVAEVL